MGNTAKGRTSLAAPHQFSPAVFHSLLNILTTHWPDEPFYNGLSLFSGAGGFDIAAEQASKAFNIPIKTFACLEIEKDRCNTLRSYLKDNVAIHQEDIASVSSAYILDKCKIHREAVWIVYGGPPCQAFSQAGKQKGVFDPRGGLIFEFLRFIKEIRPKFFILENVANLRGIKKGLLFQQIIDKIKSLGYRVDARILLATDFGSPQKRRRYFFVGTRADLAVTARLPEPTHGDPSGFIDLLPIRTLGDAFVGLPKPDYG